MHRSFGGAPDYMDDPRVRRERWDRDRFERTKRGRASESSVLGGSHAGGRGDDSRHSHFEEHDRFPGGSRDIDFREDRHHRGPMIVEKERFHEDEHFRRPHRSRTDVLREPTPSEVVNQALTPYRKRSSADRDINLNIDIHTGRPSPRPNRPDFLRRQSSLDTFDRRPLPRYGAIERYETHEYHPPTNVPIPLPIRQRRQSSSRRFWEEDEYDDARFDDREGRSREREEFREIEIHKEKSRTRSVRSRAKSIRSSSSSSAEEAQLARATWGKKGKTRLPKRLVKKQAIVKLGYPFVEEDDFLIVTRALEKEHIDEIIKISEDYHDEKVTYVYEEKEKFSEAPAPAPSPPPGPAAPSHHEGSVAPPPSHHAPSHHAPSHHAPPHRAPSHHAPSHYAPSERSPSPPSHEHQRHAEVDRYSHTHRFATSPHPHEHRITRRRSERDIREEIRMLEEERRMLKYERGGELDIIELRQPKRDVIRVDRDRKALRRDSRMIAAMMATLT